MYFSVTVRQALGPNQKDELTKTYCHIIIQEKLKHCLYCLYLMSSCLWLIGMTRNYLKGAAKIITSRAAFSLENVWTVYIRFCV